MKRVAIISAYTALPPLVAFGLAWYSAETKSEVVSGSVAYIVFWILLAPLAPAFLFWSIVLLLDCFLHFIPVYPLIPHQEEVLFFTAIPFSICAWWRVWRCLVSIRGKLNSRENKNQQT